MDEKKQTKTKLFLAATAAPHETPPVQSGTSDEALDQPV